MAENGRQVRAEGGHDIPEVDAVRRRLRRPVCQLERRGVKTLSPGDPGRRVGRYRWCVGRERLQERHGLRRDTDRGVEHTPDLGVVRIHMHQWLRGGRRRRQAKALGGDLVEPGADRHDQIGVGQMLPRCRRQPKPEVTCEAGVVVVEQVLVLVAGRHRHLPPLDACGERGSADPALSPTTH